MADFIGEITNSLPSDKLLHWFGITHLVFPKRLAHKPLPQAKIIFTDGPGKSGKAGIFWPPNNSTTCSGFSSTQRAKIGALIFALETFPNEPINTVSDSAYSEFVLKELETAHIKPTIDPEALLLFSQLQQLLHMCALSSSFYFSH